MRLLALAFCAVLAGCATTTVKMYPPQELIANCEVAPLQYSTNEDLAISVVRLAGAIKLCNIDKAKLREWAKD